MSLTPKRIECVGCGRFYTLSQMPLPEFCYSCLDELGCADEFDSVIWETRDDWDDFNEEIDHV